MAEEVLGSDELKEPSNEVNEGTAVPKETTEQGQAITEEQPTAKWMSQLPKELREDATLKGFNTIGDLAKAYLKEKATPIEEKTEEGGTLDGILEDNGWDEFKKEFIKEGEVPNPKLDEFVEFAKQSTLTPKQAKALLETTQKYTEAQQQVVQKQREEAPKKCREFLQKQWGEDYEKGMQDVKKGATKILTDDEFSQNFKKAYQNDPFAIELLRRVGAMLTEPQRAFTSTSEHTEKPNAWGISPNLFK